MSERIFTETEKFQCVTRELKMRQQVYARRVLGGAMTQQQADREIALMAAIVEDYRKVAVGERLI